MSFLSIQYAAFLTICFIVYWFVLNKSRTLQNFFLLAAGFIYYALLDYRFFLLTLLAVIFDYYLTRSISIITNTAKRKLFLWVGLIENIGILCYFKYLNFFLNSSTGLLNLLGVHSTPVAMNIILPVGISFLTFMKISYIVDVYRKYEDPIPTPLGYLNSIFFFPIVFAGPIERPARFHTQFAQPRVFDDRLLTDGLRQILGGLLKKVVIADNIALIIDPVYKHPTHYYGSELFIAAVLYAIQLYADFAGYSDIAIGSGKLFGFKLTTNFSFPYFSRNISEFWRRWHISLSNWLRDYVFASLGGAMGSKLRSIRNVLITFAICGLWHGAGWNYIVWGLLIGVYFIPSLVSSKHEKLPRIVAKGKVLPNLRETYQIASTFLIVVFAFIFFRIGTISGAIEFIGSMITTAWSFHVTLYTGIFYAVPFVVWEWWQRSREHSFSLERFPLVARWSCYYAATLLFILFGVFGSNSGFIYAQF